jgi:trigger factor
MEAELSRLLKSGMESQISKYLLAKCDLELPEGLSQRQTERVVSRRMVELYRGGVPDTEIQKHLDELRSAAAEEAKDDLKLFFIMEKIAEELEVAVSEEEINSAIAQMAQRRNRRFDRVRDEIIRSDNLQALYLHIRDEKILERLLEDARITETEPSGKADAPEGGTPKKGRKRSRKKAK